MGTILRRFAFGTGLPRVLIGTTWLIALVACASCGRVAPSITPIVPPEPGTLIVTSEPSGAAIWLDHAATATVTPDTLREVAAGEHVVSVLLDGFSAAPESLLIDLSPADTAKAAFTLTAIEEGPLQVVLLEGFSNVDCTGCPQMNETILSLMAEPGHGLDRVLLIKYAANWPAIADPHYQANPAANTARLTFYQPYLSIGIPTLAADGGLAGASGSPPAIADLRTLVDALLQGNPGFSIAVEASVPSRATTVTATAILHAERPIARAGAVLNFALVQNPVVYGSPPGSEGETVFHWVMRDFATAADAPLPLAGEQTRQIDATLTRQTSWPADQLYVIAFVQDPSTREVLQSGYGAVTALLAAAPSHLGDPASLVTPSPQPRGSP
jgi:hypothetical protein